MNKSVFHRAALLPMKLFFALNELLLNLLLIFRILLVVESLEKRFWRPLELPTLAAARLFLCALFLN